MIQDIAPHVYDNHYEEWTACGEDIAVIVRGGIRNEEPAALLLPTGDGEWIFPRIGGLPLSGEEIKEGIFLFSIDGERYFLFMDSRLPDPADGRWFERRMLREISPRVSAFAAVTALSLSGWYAGTRFCSRCAAPLERDHRERMLRCPECGRMVYPTISPAVIVGVTRGNELLLTRYSGRQYKRYALVAGFTEIGETPEETVRREVLEETGLHVTNIRYYKSQPWPFTDTLLMGFYCDEAGEEEIRVDRSELSTADWVLREDIDKVQDSYDDVSLTCEMIKYFRDHPEEF